MENPAYQHAMHGASRRFSTRAGRGAIRARALPGHRRTPHRVLYALVGDDSALIAAMDRIMGDLYEERRLTCPGHRWSSGEVPSIRGCLLGLYENGWLYRGASGQWTSDGAYDYVVWPVWQTWLHRVS
jgi:hypothetical protein